jgi:hypothetical protein
MIWLRVRYMRPHDATPTVTATLTAMSQIFVRIVTLPAILHRTYAGDVKPTLRDVAVLAGLQVGISALMTAVISLLPSTGGTNSWVGAVGSMIGAQSFVMLDARKQPGRVSAPGFAHRISIGAVVAQLVLAALAAGILAAVSPETFANVASTLGGWWSIVIIVGVALTYLMTRVGLRMGIKNVARAQAAAEAKNKP